MTEDEVIAIVFGVLGILILGFILLQIILYVFHAIGVQRIAKRQIYKSIGLLGSP